MSVVPATALTGAGGPLGRDGMAFGEKMKRLHGEIERLVYAAEIVCDGEKDFNICSELPCTFHGKCGCTLCDIRSVIGDHIRQDDAMPAVPPCQYKI